MAHKSKTKTMKDYGIDKGLIQFRDDSGRDKRGWGKGFWGWRKMFRDYLAKLNVAFYDTCCTTSTDAGIYPVRYNANLQRLEYFNGSAWVDITGIAETTTTTTSTTTTTTAG